MERRDRYSVYFQRQNEIIKYFSFQAEDGIRYATVTGVQTCALPIFRRRLAPIRQGRQSGPPAHARVKVAGDDRGVEVILVMAKEEHVIAGVQPAGHVVRPLVEQIGRASCREREWVSVIAELVKGSRT